MLECLILGDSIGVGIHNYRPDCVNRSVTGLNSWQWNRQFGKHDNTAKTVIISLGTNDHQFVRTRDELEKLRSGVQAERVYWIVPNIKKPVQDTVEQVAQKYGDMILKIPGIKPGKLHPDPRGYKSLAEQAQ